MVEKEVVISELGHQGDGIVRDGMFDRELYVPLALPGEVVKVELNDEQAVLKSIVSSSPDRVKPTCAHYKLCGGCNLQHLSKKAYVKWKTDHIIHVFKSHGIVDLPLESMFVVEEKTRRRAVLGARRTKKDVILGFHARKSHDIVDISECSIVTREIESKFDKLKMLLRPLLSRRTEARLTVTQTDTGLDISIENIQKEPDADTYQDIARMCHVFGISRLSLEKDIIFSQTQPTLTFHNVSAEVAPGGFLQAAEAAQNYMIEFILAHLDGAHRVADLFCGMGTFTLPIARKASVTAFENDASSLEYLRKSCHKQQGLKPVKVVQHDLFIDPLIEKELNDFDVVVIDPPRSGAYAQSQYLSNSSVPVIICVSCNPATLARDIKCLIDGGYKLTRIVPVDQFLYSPHVEVLAVLKR